MEIIAWSENLTSEKAESHGARWVPKRRLFQEADILTSSAGFIMSTDWNGRRERLRASARVSLRITTACREVDRITGQHAVQLAARVPVMFGFVAAVVDQSKGPVGTWVATGRNARGEKGCD